MCKQPQTQASLYRELLGGIVQS